MEIRALEFSSPIFNRFFNLGDDIQTVAVSRLLPQVDGYVCREALDTVTTDCIVPMNGFFMNTDHWPPSRHVHPLFFAFHVRPEAVDTIFSPAGVDYLKQWQPIGCRDRGTLALMQQHGIDAYYSRCVTLTLPRREQAPAQGDVFIVGISNAEHYAIPRSLRQRAIVVDQAKIRLPITSSRLKLALAAELLEQYRQRARLVITSKIHCAMPCIAMGIPVVFLYDHTRRDDYRVQIVDELIGINYVHKHGLLAATRNRMLSRQIDWSPQPLDIETLKSEIRGQFDGALERLKRSIHQQSAQAAMR